MRVLIAEDDPVSRRLLEHTLRSWNYDVLSVSNGHEALSILQQDDAPRLALLDWMMPEADGPQICRAVRAFQKKRYTYILLLTSRTNSEDVAVGIESGADDYVTKPFDSVELKARLLAGRRIIELEDELLRTQEILQHQAMHDPLTGVLNRSAILEKLDAELQRSRRHNTPLTVIMADIDQFKAINDAHGHQVGDTVLRTVVGRMARVVRVYDAVGRYGGEEFLIVLPGCDRETARSLSQRLYAEVRKPASEHPRVSVTCSFGVATTLDGNLSADALLQSADAALYDAKRSGRDRVTVAD